MTRRGLLTAALAALCACSKAAPPPAAPAPAPSTARDVVLFLGDSLTAGYGLSQEEAYPALLEARWRAEGRPRRSRNAGVSGATSAGVLENLSWSLAPDVAVAVVCVGGNDGLRGLDVGELEKNLDAIVARAQAAGVKVVVAGMRMPPNYGRDYAERFAALYPRVAAKRGVPLIPFLLDRVAGLREMNQPDGIHPNAAGHRVLAETVHSGLLKAGLL
ncbi:MAG: lipase/acylhydrolase [Elusimicrobia bacterium]|nr:MAG: lipase/acylhydrolase [Elusimicrobiota bacterium]